MEQIFKLKNGKISFERDKILISGNYYMRILKFCLLISIAISSYSIITNIIKTRELGDEMNLGLWIGITAINIIILVFVLLWSTKSSISIADVKSIKLKRRFNNSTLYIRLKNFQTRQVMPVDDHDALKEFIEKNYSNLIIK